MVLLIVGILVPAWCSLAWIWRIGARNIGFLIGALPGIVPWLSTPETGNLRWKVGLAPTVVWRSACWLDADLLRLVILAKCWMLVLLLLIVGSCWG